MFYFQVFWVEENVLGNDAVLEGHNTLYSGYLILSIPTTAPSPSCAVGPYDPNTETVSDESSTPATLLPTPYINKSQSPSSQPMKV